MKLPNSCLYIDRLLCSVGKTRDNPYHFVDFTILFSEKQLCKTATEIKLFKLIGKSDCKV